jgi:hypothetical protein
MRHLPAVILSFFLLLNPAAADSGPKPWLDWFTPANANLRTVISYLRTDSIDLAALALEELIASRPPEDLSPELSEAARNGQEQAKLALDEIDNGNGKAARERLFNLRETLFQTNQQNNIEVFADCIWQVRGHGPALWHYRHETPDLNDDTVRSAVEKVTDAYLSQLEKCDAIAPKAVKEDESLANRDVGQFIRFIREIISFDNLLYFRHG